MFQLEMKWYISVSGNDQYILIPLKIQRGPLCTKVNAQYRKYLMKELASASDLPNSDTEDLCPMFVKVKHYTFNQNDIYFIFWPMQKTYLVKDYLFASERIPLFLQRGWYKLHILIYDNEKSGTLVSGLHWTLHLY